MFTKRLVEKQQKSLKQILREAGGGRHIRACVEHVRQRIVVARVVHVTDGYMFVVDKRFNEECENYQKETMGSERNYWRY